MKLDPQAPAEQLFEGCWRITLPDPFVPNVTSVFLLAAGSHSWLFDAGADSDDSVETLRQKLRRLGIRLDDITGCLLSHAHLDHAGGLFRWRPRSLVVHERAAAEMANPEPRSSRGPAALRRMGVPEELVPPMAPVGEPVDTRIREVEVDRRLSGESGEVPDTPGWRWLLAEGHAPGHLMLYHDSGCLLAGDQFLIRWKTPYLISDPTFDSFGAYLASVEVAIGLEPEAIYPSHTRAIRPGATWLRERRASLEQQVERTLETTRAGAATAYETVQALYPGDRKPGITVLLLREQLAVLRHLVGRGAVRRREEDGVERFEPTT